MCLDLERHSLDVEFLRFRRHQDNTTAVWPRVETRHHSVSRYSLTKYICSHLQIFLLVCRYNNADAAYNTATINTNVIVSHTGTVTWLSHGMFKSSCDISVEYFPFDIQDCHLKWASWTYDGFAVRR